MSQTTLISNQYQNFANLSERVNEAILILKKEHYLADPNFRRQHQTMSVSTIELSDARLFLLGFLCDIEKSYTSSGQFDDDFINTLQHKVLTKDKISNTKKVINENQILTEAQLKTLDSLLLTIDNKRTTLFRKLRN